MALDAIGLTTVEGPYFEQTWDFTDPEFCWMRDYWQEKRGDRPCPRLRDINLPSLFRQAPKIVIKDAIDDGRDFRVRYWGTNVTDWLKFDGSGKLLSDYFPQKSLEQVKKAHLMALNGDIPMHRWGVSTYPNRDFLEFETIDLPLENDEGKRAHILSLHQYRIQSRDDGSEA